MCRYLLCLFFLFFSSAVSDDLVLYTENSGYNNYLDKQGQLRGHSVDMVREIQKRLGTNYKIEVVPWARAYNQVLSKDKKVAVFSMTRNEDRDKLFKWVGPLYSYDIVLFARKNFQKKISSLEDAKSVKAIACYLGDVREKYLQKSGFKNLDSISGSNVNALNFKKLLAGRVDLWICSRHVMIKTALEAGVPLNEIKDAYIVDTRYTYLAFSQAVEDETVQLWQRTLDSMKKDKSYEKIMMAYPVGGSAVLEKKLQLDK